MDYEKLGAFYLGREVDPSTHELTEKTLLYDSNDLTTHAVIIGMTGSGKTGLGIDIIEEAAIDGVPVIAVDPKGDLGNLALTFPNLAPADFEPWVNPREAQREGKTTAAYAAEQAKMWKDGLASWGQPPERIARLRQAAEVRIYTPGSSAGRPLSVLRSFNAPSAAVLGDADIMADRLEATATGLLTLLGVDADPLTSREHILLTTVLEHAWRNAQDLSLAALIQAVQQPPVKKIGVMDLDVVYPAKDRMKLALQLNNLLAAPSFEAWTQGDPLDVQDLLYGPDGHPRVSVLSIAHLSDPERMFFLSLMLAETLAWMRSQEGTGSLRALLYIDELFGFMPPVANPATKKPLLTLLKQARAFGLGLVLSTQNPVDLDYKGLSNAGTWFIGRLQTERDKARVIDGLRSAAPGSADAGDLSTTISGLGKRTFLLHNVHDSHPVVFQTRWAMSYLAGPLSRDQIRRLSRGGEAGAEDGATATQAAAAAGTAAADRVAPQGSVTRAPAASAPVASTPTAAKPVASTPAAATPPAMLRVLPPDVPQLYAPLDAPAGVTYLPFVLGAATVFYSSKTYDVEERREVANLVEPIEGPVPVAWSEGRPLELDLNALQQRPEQDVGFGELPSISLTGAEVKRWASAFTRFVRTDVPLELWRSKPAGLVSNVDESERDFRVRCQHAIRELRDAERDKLRDKYAKKVDSLEKSVAKAQSVVERESQQRQQKTLDAAINVGTTLLGAFLGRRTPTATRMGSSVRSVTRIQKESGDVQRAKETVAGARAELAGIQADLERELAGIKDIAETEIELETVVVRTTSTNVQARFVGLLWVPHRQTTEGRWVSASPIVPG